MKAGQILLIPAVIVIAASAARADVQTALTFVSPSTIEVGGTVMVDLSVNYIPVPQSLQSSQFIDNGTAAQVSSCASDPNACTELQFGNTASTLTSVEAVVIAANSTGAPQFFSTISTGTSQLALSYPNAGTWGITAETVLDNEQISELECITDWNMEAPVGAASCSTFNTVSFTGTFDPDGPPTLSVTVDPAGTLTAEPANLGLLGISLTMLGLWRRLTKRRTNALIQNPVLVRVSILRNTRV